MEFLPISEKYVLVTASSGKRWITRLRSFAYPFVSVAAKSISINKNLAYEFAAAHGVSTPATLYVPDQQDALTDFLKQYAPVVVKPLDSSGSRGLTLNIEDEQRLNEAIKTAQEFSKTVIVQQQFFGQEVRLTVADGEVVSVILRQPAQLIGDGASTVAELLEQENKAREDLQFAPIPYPFLTPHIIPEHYFSDTRVPAEGEVIELSKNSLTKGGASLYEISDSVHPSYIEKAKALAQALNPGFMVIDLMIADYTKPADEENYIFVEFNSAPSLRLYIGMRNGKQYDMAAKLADMIDAWSRKND